MKLKPVLFKRCRGYFGCEWHGFGLWIRAIGAVTCGVAVSIEFGR